MVGHLQQLVKTRVHLQPVRHHVHLRLGRRQVQPHLAQCRGLRAQLLVEAAHHVEQRPQALVRHAAFALKGFSRRGARVHHAQLAHHGLVHAQHVQPDPRRQEPHHAGRPLGAGVALAPQLAQVDDELLVLAAVHRHVAAIQPVGLHHQLFARELRPGVSHQAVKRTAQRHLAPVGRELRVKQGAVQLVEDVDQPPVLVVHFGQAGAKTAVPNKQVHGVLRQCAGCGGWARGRAIGPL